MAFDAVFERFALLLHWLGAGLVLAIAGLSVYDTALRNFLNAPLLGTPELVANGLVLIAFCQAPWVILKMALLRVTILTGTLARRVQTHLEAIAYLAGMAFFLAIAWYAIEPTMQSWTKAEFFGSVMFRIPAWPIRFSTLFLWVVCALACAVVIARLYGRGAEPVDATKPIEEIV